jgi:hypothetical protein
VRYPAFISDSVRSSSSDTNSHDMGTGIIELSHALMDRFKYARTRLNHIRKFIHRHCANQLSIRNPCPVPQLNRLILQIDFHNFCVQQKFILWQSLCNSLPNTSGTTMSRESESRVGTPISCRFIQNDILCHRFEVWCSNTFTKPLTLHSSRRYSPYFKVIRTHE